MRWSNAVMELGLVVVVAVFVSGCESSAEESRSRAATSGHQRSTGNGTSRGSNGDRSERRGADPKENGSGSGLHDSHDGNEHAAGEGGEQSRTVELTEKAESRYDIEISEAAAGSLADHVTATAKVEHNPRQTQHVSPLVRGRISELKVTVGSHVERGQKLAVLRSIDLGEARADVQKAKSNHEIASANFERIETLRSKGIVSERRYLEAKQELEAARAELEASRSKLQTYGVGGGSGPYYVLSSEIEGRVIEQNASQGEVKGPAESLYVVADNSPVWVIGQVYERDVSRVERGMKAAVTLEAYPARTWQGTVEWVADTVDPKTRNLAVRVPLDNEDGEIRPGMFGAVHLQSSRDGELALVPVGAVQSIHGEEVVFVPGDEAGHYRATRVQTGEESKGMVEIRTGLAPGDAYVTKGAFDLRATVTASSRAGGHHH